MDFGPWVGVVAVIVALASLYYQRRQTLMMQATRTGASANVSRLSWLNTGTVTLIVLVALAWTPWFLQQNYSIQPNATILDYGLTGQPFTFYARINTEPLKRLKETYYLALIIRFQYANVDRMSDTAIDRSIQYTLDGSHIRMTVVGQTQPVALRVDPSVSAVTIEYDAVLIPRSFSTEQIKSLNDIERVGGRILSTVAQGVPFGSLGIAVSSTPGTTK